MVTTRLQERLGLDTPNSSSIEDTSNSTASPSVSRATRKRTGRDNETPKNPAKTRASRYSVETEQTTPQPSQSQIDTPVTTNEQNLPERLKSPVEFYTPAPAKTPANKRKRFDSDEPEDSFLDMFQTPAEYPRTHDVATEGGEEEGDDDSDAAPEVVSTRSSARRGRNPPGSSAKSSGTKRKKTTTITDQDKESTPTSGPVTIDVVKPKSTPSEVLAQVDEDADAHHLAVSTEQALEADATAATVEDKDQIESVANTADNQTLTDSDTTVTALPSTSLPAGEEEYQSAVAQVEDTSTIVVEPTVNNETLNDQEPAEANGHEDTPSSSTARTDQQDKTSSHVRFETTTVSPTSPLQVPAVTNPTTTTSDSKQSVPISSHRSTAADPQSHTDSPHPSSVVEKARATKKQKISTRRQPTSALVHQHLPKPKPTSLSDFRSRMLNRHVRTANFGAPGQKRVKFVAA